MQNEGRKQVEQKGQKCHFCGNSGARWVVEWNRVRHPVHQPCGHRLKDWAPPDAAIRIFPSAELRAEWRTERESKIAQAALGRMEEARNSGRRTVKLRELREAVASR